MTEDDSLNLLATIIKNIKNEDIQLKLEHDLRTDNILDSFEMLVFFMELEKASSMEIPDTEILLRDGWYKIQKLCHELEKLNHKPGE